MVWVQAGDVQLLSIQVNAFPVAHRPRLARRFRNAERAAKLGAIASLSPSRRPARSACLDRGSDTEPVFFNTSALMHDPQEAEVGIR